MILNVSGRTDVVAFYTDWFMNRYKEGFLDVRNPFNKHLISRIFFEDVDAILFCTKNPLPIVDRLKEIDKPIVFQVTVTPYKRDIEPHVPDKKEVIGAIRKISKIVGLDNLFVRYDPIFLNDNYDLEYHKRAFRRLCESLKGAVEHIIVSFIDDYKNVQKNMSILKVRELKEADYKEIGESFSASAREYGMSVQTCFEERNLTEYGFIKGECLSIEYAYKLTGKANFKPWLARKERKCNCVQMVDVGVYNSCKHFCKYCYANYDERQVDDNFSKHDDSSTLLVGYVQDGDVIKRRLK